LCLSARNRKRPIWKRLGCAAKTLRSLGALDCPVAHRIVSGAPGWLGRTSYSRVSSAAYGYKSPNCPVVHRPRNPRATRGRANGQKGAPDCPVYTGQCPVRQRLWIFNVQRSAAPKQERNPHRTVSGGEPDCPMR
jgi:hypothetical protein